MWKRYGILCHQGVSTRDVIVEVVARNVLDAMNQVRAMGYTPQHQCVAYSSGM